MTKLITFAVVATAVTTALATPVVLAQSSSAFYVGGQFGYGSYLHNTLTDNDEFLGGVFIGYQYSDYFATQLDYQHLNNRSWITSTGRYDYDFQQAIVSGRLLYPATPKLSLALKLGASVWLGRENDRYQEGVSPVIGGGVHYSPNTNMTVGLTYQYVDSIGKLNKLDHRATMLELSWNFSSEESQSAPKISTVESTLRPTPPSAQLSPTEKKAVNNRIIYQTYVPFNFDLAIINERARTQLSTLLEKLNQDNTLSIHLDGYATPVGSKSYNQKLSERRAQAVANYLMNNGIAPSRIYAQGKGEYQAQRLSAFGQRVDAMIIHQVAELQELSNEN